MAPWNNASGPASCAPTLDYFRPVLRRRARFDRSLHVMSEKTVFISYRRDATGKAFRALDQTKSSHDRGYDVFLDVDCIDAGKWAKQILTQVPKRAHFLLLLTPGALDRCADENDWVRREFLLAQECGRNIVPVREESVDLAAMRAAAPEAVKAIFDLQIHTIQHGSFESDVETLTTRYIPPHKAPKEGIPKSTAFQADISRIIKYAPAELIGREAETKLLTDAWDQAVRGEPKRPHVLTFVALGGEGKTSLVAKWAAELAHQGWPGCDAVFAWSFYSQGTREQTAVSSDAFLAEALTFFGDPAMAGSAQGAFDKGRRLARLVGERRALLILDGVEPLAIRAHLAHAGRAQGPGPRRPAQRAGRHQPRPLRRHHPVCHRRSARLLADHRAHARAAASLDGRRGEAAPDHRRENRLPGRFREAGGRRGRPCPDPANPRTVPRARLPRRHPPPRPHQASRKRMRRSRAATPSGRWRPM